jgi:hypothetical protein
MRRADLSPRLLAVAAAMLVAVAAAALFLPVVAVEGGGAGLHRVAFPGTPVMLSHVHSVERTLVEDRFEVGWRGGLVHRRSVTRSYGAGLPAESRSEGGVLAVAGRGQRHRSIPLRFGPDNDPLLRIGGHQVSLAAEAAQGRMTLRVQRLWERLPPLSYLVASFR